MAQPKARVMSRRRSALVWALVVLATVLTLVASLTVWSKRQLLDTDAWTKSSSKLLANDEIRTTLSSRLVDLLYQRVDVTTQLEQRLPEQTKSAAPVIAAAVQNAAGRVIDAFLASAPAQTLWEQANRRGHAALVNVLEGDPAGPISTQNGDVVLDLRPLIDRVATRLGVQDRLKERASPTTGEILILRSDQLDAAQTAVKAIKALSVWLALGVLVLYGLAIYLARGRRRTFLEAAGVGLLLVGLILLLVRRYVGNAVVDSLVKTDANRPAVRSVWLIETDLMRDIAIALIVYGLIAVVAGILGGPSRVATAIRRALAPSFRERPLAVFGVACIVFLIVVALTPIGSAQRLVGLGILSALLLFGLEVWRRQTIREFPGEEPIAS